MHLQSLAKSPPASWETVIQPTPDLSLALVAQYVLHPDATANMEEPIAVKWRALLLSPHIGAVVRNQETNYNIAESVHVNVCHKCCTFLSDSKMPKHAIANGLYMGRAAPELGFADDITSQEW